MKQKGRIKADDPTLIRIIRDSYLDFPNPQINTTITKFSNGQLKQVLHVLEYFKAKNGAEKRNGFFVEAGAFDGKKYSNTLRLEMEFGWTGLLIEANLQSYKELKDKNRNAISINSCLSLSNTPQMVNFMDRDVFGRVLPNAKGPMSNDKIYPVQCFPFYSILLAIGKPKIDFFSLDVEGVELAILKSIPWNLVEIELIMVEVKHSNEAAIIALLKANGYQVWKKLEIDMLFAKS